MLNKTASAARELFAVRCSALVDVLNAFGLFARTKRDWRSARSIEFLGAPRDGALEQLVRVAKQRFGTKSVTLAGPRKVRARLMKMVAEQGLEIAQERER